MRIFTIAKKDLRRKNGWLSFKIDDDIHAIPQGSCKDPLVYYTSHKIVCVDRERGRANRIVIYDRITRKKIFERQIMFKQNMRDLGCAQYNGVKPIYIVRKVLRSIQG